MRPPEVAAVMCGQWFDVVVVAVALAFAVASPSLVVAVAYLSVIAITNVRAGIEEQMLMERYPEYVEYRNRTKRYLPYVI